MKEKYAGQIATNDPKLKHLIKIVEIKDELAWVDDAIEGLERSEQHAVAGEHYERAHLILQEKEKMLGRKYYLEEKLEDL